MDYLLTVMLYMNGPMVTMRVPDCEIGAQWIEAAWKWAERSHVKVTNGPLYVCGKAGP